MFDLQKFKKKGLIGKGAFGEVYEIVEINTQDKKKYAAKISSSAITENINEAIITIQNELNIISKLNHPSIIKYVGYNIKNFEEEPKPTIIMELAPNESLCHMINLARLSQHPSQWNQTKKVINILGIALGMAYLHSHKIIHRDLKPENILLDEYLYPKITDFGLSKICNEGTSQMTNSGVKGTPLYMSPEMIFGEYSYAADIYSFSILIYEILTEKKPFQGMSMPQITKKVLKEGFKPIFQDNFPEFYKNLIIKCGSLVPNERPTFNEICNEMEKDQQFIIEGVDEKECFNYIEFVKEYQSSFLSSEVTIHFDDFLKKKNSSIQKVSLKTEIFLYPFELYLRLNEECKQLVRYAENNPEYQYIIGKSSIELDNGFPMNTEIGLQYLKRSIKEGYTPSILYYSQILIKGEIIRRNLEKAKKLLERILDTKSAEAYALYGKIMKKEGNYSQAKIYFLKGIDRGSGKAMKNYGKMLLRGEGCDMNENEALYYFEMAKRNNYQKAEKYISMINSTKTNLTLKVILLGASGVGKTSLLNAFYNKPFCEQGITTIGCNIHKIDFFRDFSTNVKFFIWDTSGQERYSDSIPIQNYRNADAAFVCYSKDDDETVDKWIGRVKEYSPDCKIFLIETKSDQLDENQKEISRVHGKQLIQTYDCYMHLMTSSKTKENIKNLLKFAANLSVANSSFCLHESIDLERVESGSKNYKQDCNC